MQLDAEDLARAIRANEGSSIVFTNRSRFETAELAYAIRAVDGLDIQFITGDMAMVERIRKLKMLKTIDAVVMPAFLAIGWIAPEECTQVLFADYVPPITQQRCVNRLVRNRFPNLGS